jgi:hypothetical protein
MQRFTDLIPEEFRARLRSAIPHLINDNGSIVFSAEVKHGSSSDFGPKEKFILELREDGRHQLSLVITTRAEAEDE